MFASILLFQNHLCLKSNFFPQKTGDELLLSNTLKDVDEFFEKERQFLVEFHGNLKECTIKADRMTSTHKNLADTFIKISSALVELSTFDSKVLLYDHPISM